MKLSGRKQSGEMFLKKYLLFTEIYKYIHDIKIVAVTLVKGDKLPSFSFGGGVGETFTQTKMNRRRRRRRSKVKL